MLHPRVSGAKHISPNLSSRPQLHEAEKDHADPPVEPVFQERVSEILSVFYGGCLAIGGSFFFASQGPAGGKRSSKVAARGSLQSPESDCRHLHEISSLKREASDSRSDVEAATMPRAVLKCFGSMAWSTTAEDGITWPRHCHGLILNLAPKMRKAPRKRPRMRAGTHGSTQLPTAAPSCLCTGIAVSPIG